jgi:hypothetical protein
MDRVIDENVAVLVANGIDVDRNSLGNIGLGTKLVTRWRRRSADKKRKAFAESKPPVPVEPTEPPAAAAVPVVVDSDGDDSLDEKIFDDEKPPPPPPKAKKSKYFVPNAKQKIVAPRSLTNKARRMAYFRDMDRFGDDNVLEREEDCVGKLIPKVLVGKKKIRTICEED